MELTWTEINKHIDRNGPEILQRLIPLLMDPVILKQLVKEGVILDYQELSLRYIADPATRCSNLMDLVKSGSAEVYCGLIKVAKLNKQTALVQLLENKPVSQQPRPTELGPPSMVQQPSPSSSKKREIHIWDKCHPNGQSLLLNEPDFERKLDWALPDLKRLLRPGDLWAYLVKYGVMDSSTVEELQAAGVSGPQVEAIVKFMKQDVVWKLHAFFRSLAQIGQANLIDLVLGPGAKETYNKDLNEF